MGVASGVATPQCHTQPSVLMCAAPAWQPLQHIQQFVPLKSSNRRQRVWHHLQSSLFCLPASGQVSHSLAKRVCCLFLCCTAT